jgi:hypothetical protein
VISASFFGSCWACSVIAELGFIWSLHYHTENDNVSVRGARSRFRPSACPSTIANVSGTAREKSGRTICDFFPKPKAILRHKEGEGPSLVPGVFYSFALHRITSPLRVARGDMRLAGDDDLGMITGFRPKIEPATTRSRQRAQCT